MTVRHQAIIAPLSAPNPDAPLAPLLWGAICCDVGDDASPDAVHDALALSYDSPERWIPLLELGDLIQLTPTQALAYRRDGHADDSSMSIHDTLHDAVKALVDITDWTHIRMSGRWHMFRSAMLR